MPARSNDTKSGTPNPGSTACVAQRLRHAGEVTPDPARTDRHHSGTQQVRTLATHHPKISCTITHTVPQDSQSGQIVVGVCCHTMKRAFLHFVSPFFRSRSSASAMASGEGPGNKPSNIMRRHRGALQMLNCHWTRAKCFATRWASFSDDKNSRHRSVTMHTGSMSLYRSLTRKTRTHSLGHSGHNSTFLGNSGRLRKNKANRSFQSTLARLPHISCILSGSMVEQSRLHESRLRIIQRPATRYVPEIEEAPMCECCCCTTTPPNPPPSSHTTHTKQPVPPPGQPPAHTHTPPSTLPSAPAPAPTPNR